MIHWLVVIFRHAYKVLYFKNINIIFFYFKKGKVTWDDPRFSEKNEHNGFKLSVPLTRFGWLFLS